MSVSQGEIVEVNFQLPNGSFKPHPVIIISNNDINEYEDGFIGVMLSSSEVADDYSFFLEDKMLSKKPKRRTQVRCHLLSLIPESEITGRHGSIKKEYLKQVINKITENVFNVD